MSGRCASLIGQEGTVTYLAGLDDLGGLFGVSASHEGEHDGEVRDGVGEDVWRVPEADAAGQ